MTPNRIRLNDRKACPSLEASSGRARRWSADPARASYYKASRTARYAYRMTH